MAVPNSFITGLNKEKRKNKKNKKKRKESSADQTFKHVCTVLSALPSGPLHTFTVYLQQRKPFLAMTFLSLWHIWNVQQSVAFLTSNLFSQSQMIPFTALMLVGSLTHILKLSLTQPPPHKHTKSLKNINKLPQTQKLFSNLEFKGKYWKSLSLRELSTLLPPLCLC